MNENQPPTGNLYSINLAPRREAWVRITTHNSTTGVERFLACAALFGLALALHIDWRSLVALGAIAAPIYVCLRWRHSPKHYTGFMGNAGLTAAITADINTELGAHDIHVDSVDGVVTLQGRVPFADFRDAAERLAQRRGAHQVIDELQVTPCAFRQPHSYRRGSPGVTTPEGAPEIATQKPLEERVLEARADGPRVNAYLMDAHIEDRIAYLTGRQDTTVARKVAMEVTVHVHGILGASKDIEILPGFSRS